MAQNPNIESVHVNVPLSTISIAYIQDQREFVADRVFPVVPVLSKSDRYYVFTRDDWFRDDAAERAPSTESAGGGYNVDNTPTYFARTYSYHKDVDDQTRSNSDSVLQPDRDATLLITQKMLIRRERQFVTKAFTTGLWTGSTTASDLTGVAGTPTSGQFKQWDQAGSTPIEDVRTQALAIKSRTGFRPNVLTLGPYVANQLINNPEIVDRVKYTQLGFLDYALLAQAFGVEEVVVPESVVNTGAEAPYAAGTANAVESTFTPGFIYGKNALLTYRPPRPGLMTPSAGYMFSWKGYLGNTSWMRIKRFRVERLESDRVEGTISFDVTQTGQDLGAFFQSAVS